MSDVDFVKVYEKDPFTVAVNVDQLKSGFYLVEGEATAESWAKACKQMGVGAGGYCKARCVFEKTHGVLKFEGHISFDSERECVRTLQSFMEEQSFEFKDEVLLGENREDENETREVLKTAILDMGDFLTQQIILNMNPYPIHPGTLASKDGEFNYLDGQEKALLEEKAQKNPFSVLKDLKSKS